MKLENKLKILWRPELVLIQEKYGMAKYKEKSKNFTKTTKRRRRRR